MIRRLCFRLARALIRLAVFLGGMGWAVRDPRLEWLCDATERLYEATDPDALILGISITVCNADLTCGLYGLMPGNDEVSALVIPREAAARGDVTAVVEHIRSLGTEVPGGAA